MTVSRVNTVLQEMEASLIKLTKEYDVLKNYHKTSSYVPPDLEKDKRFVSGRIVQITYDMKKIQNIFAKQGGIK